MTSRRATAACAGMLILCVLAGGCAEKVGVRVVTEDKGLRRGQSNALTASSPSEQTALYLRSWALADLQRRDPMQVLDVLEQMLRAKPDRTKAFVLAELSYLQAKRHRLLDPDKAVQFYTTTLLCAYASLFDPTLGEPASPYDAEFRVACGLYNHSLAKLASIARQRGNAWGETHEWPSLLGPVRISSHESHLPWAPDDKLTYMPTYTFEVTGIDNQYRTSGLGVPLIVGRHMPPRDQRTEQDRFLNPNAENIYPATLLVELHGPVCGNYDENNPREATIRLYDPFQADVTELAGQTLRLETDLTTPLAYAVQHAPKMKGTTGLFDTQAWNDKRGLYMMHPYQRGKIPIVFVHGLMSTPQTWLEMVNDLMGDPEVRDRYQCWYFLYPSGNPFSYSAAVLRQGLLEARETFDPDGTDPAFDQMVVVGHSMGGLVSKMIVQTSRGELWANITAEPLEEVELGDAERELIRRVLFFERIPFVRRVVFIATPHRGSEIADWSIAGWAASLIKLPFTLVKASGDLFSGLLQVDPTIADRIGDGVATSIDALKPENPMLATLNEIPIGPGVPYHSIIGDAKAADRKGGTDKVVPYSSSHLDGADSEIIVKATHTEAHRVAPAVVEVKRILMEHLGEVPTTTRLAN